MPLANNIHELRERVLLEMTATWHYFEDSRQVWRVVHHVAEGEPVAIRNRSTGAILSADEIEQLAQGYVREYLTVSTFQQFLASFEDFIFGVIRLWLLRFPERLGKKQIFAADVFAAPDLDSIKRELVDREVGDLRYRKVKDWFIYLESMVKLGCPSSDEINQLAEAKVSRDVLVHNRGIANTIYEEKAGDLKRFNAGERIEIPEAYHLSVWELLRKVITDVADAAISRAPE